MKEFAIIEYSLSMSIATKYTLQVHCSPYICMRDLQLSIDNARFETHGLAADVSPLRESTVLTTFPRGDPPNRVEEL